MYLRELFIRNNGPISGDLHLEFAFNEDGKPLPHVIVGRNGSGKTNLLSIIADALMQGASRAYTDVLAQQGIGRSYFRMVGGKTLSYGQQSALTILKFSDDEGEVFFRENAGAVTAEQAKEFLPPALHPGAKWSETKSGKEFELDNDKARRTYGRGAYVYFPASRSEKPFWFNEEAIAKDEFDVTDRVTSRLGKPMFVEHGIDAFAQWLLGALTESRMVVDDANYAPSTQDEVILRVNTRDYIPTQLPLLWADAILKVIMDDESAQFYWTGRRNARKVGVKSGDRVVADGLDSLSGGQSTLLAIFGTILRYGDEAGFGPADTEGIVIIDELDAHMHVDLQLRSLPRLISLFSSIQFLISSHSPFFSLGMERHFSPTGARVLELPSGNTVTAEAYEEFGQALDAIRETRAFEDGIRQELEKAELPIIWVAGETDVPYFQTASDLLGVAHLRPYFQWIGTPGTSGGGDFTGDNSLKNTVKFLRANSGFSTRKIVVVFDCDANQTDDQFDSVHVIGLTRLNDALVADGIENLLPATVFTEDVFQDRQIDSGIDGRPKIIPEIRKTLLSERLCGEGAHPDNFQNFRPILERIAAILPPPDDEDDAESTSTSQPGSGSP